MKFSNGFWLMRQGVQAHGAVDVRDIAVANDRVTLFIAPMNVVSRGQTLSGPLLTLEFTSPQPDILGVRMTHFKGAVKKGPEFTLADEKAPLSLTETETGWQITTGALTAIIEKNPFSLRYEYKGRFLTGSATKQLAYLTTPEGPFIRERLDLSVGECIYGLGERFSHFVKNGQSVDVWNEDGGTASEQAYKNIPFFLSNRSYGVLVNHPERVSFEIGSEAVSKNQFSVAGETMQYFIIGGDTPVQVLSAYAGLTGKPALPPPWSFGLWLSTSFTTSYDEETVNHFIDGMQQRDIPLTVFHFDCFWMKEYEWCNFEWDADQFPDAGAMLRRLKEKGLSVCVWINPYIGQKSKLFDEGMEKGYLLKRPNGDVWQWDLWQPGMGLVDFTNPEAAKWYQDKLSQLMDMGVDAFKTDFGERIPVDVAYHDGSDAQKMHNYYTYLFNKTVFDLLERRKGKGNAVVFARSATVGSQSFPVHWGGDCEATYTAMAESLRGGLSLSLGAFGFWSHDIGGFESTASSDVYKRWIAFGLFSTHSRLHGSSSYRVPWLYDEESVDVLRYFTRFKHRLMPYLFAQSVKAHETGIPVMRPMFLEYPEDSACSYLDRQYLFGDSLLVAPVFAEDGIENTYLPYGTFTHLLTGQSYEGGRYVKETYDYLSLPVFARPNSIVAMGRRDDSPVYDYAHEVDLHGYAIENAQAALYDTQGAKAADITMARQDNQLVVTLRGRLTAGRLYLHQLALSASQEGLTLQSEGENTLVQLPDINGEMTFTFTIG